MGLGQLAFVACAGSLASGMLVIDTQRFNGSKVDANADAGTDYAALVPGNKSGGGDDQGGLPHLVRALANPFASVRSALRKCAVFGDAKLKTKFKSDTEEGGHVKAVRTKLDRVYYNVGWELGLGHYFLGTPDPECADQADRISGILSGPGGFVQLKESGTSRFANALCIMTKCSKTQDGWKTILEPHVEKFCADVEELPAKLPSGAQPLGKHHVYAEACCKRIEKEGFPTK